MWVPAALTRQHGEVRCLEVAFTAASEVNRALKETHRHTDPILNKERGILSLSVSCGSG